MLGVKPDPYAAVTESILQMRARSGPLWDLAKERGQIMSEAYRAAGSPAHVTIVNYPDGGRYARVIGHGASTRFEPATEAEWRAWRAWATDRDRLRQELRIWRGPSGKSRRDAARAAADERGESEAS